MYNVKITGFKTKEQAIEFMNWYEGQGEQDASLWFSCRKEEGIIDVDFMPVMEISNVWDGNSIEMKLDI